MATIYSVPKFSPLDESLVLYLLRKINGLPMPENYSVHEYDLYGVTEPWEIWEMFKGENRQELYFLTKLKQMAFRVRRRVGSGTWTRENSGKLVSVQGFPVSVRRYRYENVELKEEDGQWVLLEYRIQGRNSVPGDDEYVICRLKKEEKKKNSKERKRKSMDSEEESCISFDRNVRNPNQVSSFDRKVRNPNQVRKVRNPNQVRTSWLHNFEIVLLPNPFFSDDWVRGWKILSE